MKHVATVVKMAVRTHVKSMQHEYTVHSWLPIFVKSFNYKIK